MALIRFIVVENDDREKVLGSATIDGCLLYWAAKEVGIENPRNYTIKKWKNSKDLNWLDHIEDKDHVYYLKLKEGVEFSASSPANFRQRVKSMSYDPSRQAVSTSNVGLFPMPLNEDIEMNSNSEISTPDSSYIDFDQSMHSDDEDAPITMAKEMSEEDMEKLRQYLSAMRDPSVTVRDFTPAESSQNSEGTHQTQIERNRPSDSSEDEMNSIDEVDLPNTTLIEEFDSEQRPENELVHRQFESKMGEICDTLKRLK